MSNNELSRLLEEYYLEEWEKFFKVIRDNNLSIDDNLIIDKEGDELYYLGESGSHIVRDFYDYWLSHNSSLNFGFVNLRC